MTTEIHTGFSCATAGGGGDLGGSNCRMYYGFQLTLNSALEVYNLFVCFFKPVPIQIYGTYKP